MWEDIYDMNIINKIKAATVAGAIVFAGMFSGCMRIIDRFGKELALPDNAQEFVMEDRDSAGMMFMEVNGRTYAPYGNLRGTMRNDSIRDCLGYVGGDKNTRVYTLYEDPYDNYILVKNVNGVMDEDVYWRDFSTYGEDIFTPEYIRSMEYEEWGRSSGVYYEIRAMIVNVTVNADGVKELDFEYTINGRQGGEGGAGYLDGALLNKGEVMACDISEVSLNDKFSIDDPFEVKMWFRVILEDGTVVEVSGEFTGTVELGESYEMELTGNAEDGYKIQ